MSEDPDGPGVSPADVRNDALHASLARRIIAENEARLVATLEAWEETDRVEGCDIPSCDAPAEWVNREVERVVQDAAVKGYRAKMSGYVCGEHYAEAVGRTKKLLAQLRPEGGHAGLKASLIDPEETVEYVEGYEPEEE